jgi:excisionase family DNA binding protein
MARQRTRGEERALFVRIPADEASKLDRAAFELKLSKQELIAGLVARHVDPTSASSLAQLRRLRRAVAADVRRVVVETGAEEMTVGRHAFQPAPPAEVLTLAEAAELLRAAEAVVAALAEAGELPGRRVGGEWRFARRALVAWLEAGEGRGGASV